MKALTESKPGGAIPQVNNMPHQQTLSRMARCRQTLRRWWPFDVMALPGVIYFFIWHYLPIWETKIAFEQYRIIPPNIWVGMQYFATLMSSPVFWQVIQNTVIIGAMKLIFIFPVPIIIAIATLSPVDGAVNDIIKSMGYDPIPFMTDSGSIRWVLVFTEMWRSAGWDSLLYIAAILAIDPQLYEAAEMDGAGRWRKIWHITLPAITPTIATLFILNVGLFLSQGFDQVFNMTNDVVNGQIDIIDTYVYRMGLRTGEFSLATAAGLFKGVIGMILIVLAHNVSKRLTGKGVW